MKIRVLLAVIALAVIPMLLAQAQITDWSDDNEFLRDPLAQNDFEKKALEVMEDILENQAYLNVPREDARMMRVMAESMNAKNIVEIGTSTGYSAIWFGLALKKTGGKLTTFEIDHERAEKARHNFAAAGMADIITLVEGDAHKEVSQLKEPIDLLFLDADKEGYIDYFTKLLPLVRPGGLIIGDNITLDMADPRYIDAITKDPSLETVVRGAVSYTVKKLP